MSKLLWAGLFWLSVFSNLGFATEEIEPGTSQSSVEKIRWLDRYGTLVYIDRPSRKGKFYACQEGDHAFLRRPWGLEYTWLNQDVVACPSFFKHKK